MSKTTVAAIIHNDQAQVLLTRRNIPPFKDLWILPGGHIDDYETAQTDIVREVKEETGLDFAATLRKQHWGRRTLPQAKTLWIA